MKSDRRPERGTLRRDLAACVELGRSLGFEEGHARQDARLATRLFDLTADLHGLDDEERRLLLFAALLHDVGYVEGYEGHHKTSYERIMAAALPGLSDRQKLMVALVARYHRGAAPSPGHRGYDLLEPHERDKVTCLGALLRLADGLDRTHTGAVRGLDLERYGGELFVWVRCPAGCDEELWAGEKKGRLLGQLFGLQVKVRHRDQTFDVSRSSEVW